MRDIRNVNIWKEEPRNSLANDDFHNIDILDLNLSVRSYNCLKRAGCHSIGDVIQYMDEDGQGLRKIRNLGTRSEKEIIEKIDQMKEEYAKHAPARKEYPNRVMIKAGNRFWNRRIDEFTLSKASMSNLRKCGIRQVSDLYSAHPKSDPGWYAVRELFEALI